VGLRRRPASRGEGGRELYSITGGGREKYSSSFQVTQRFLFQRKEGRPRLGKNGLDGLFDLEAEEERSEMMMKRVASGVHQLRGKRGAAHRVVKMGKKKSVLDGRSSTTTTYDEEQEDRSTLPEKKESLPTEGRNGGEGSNYLNSYAEGSEERSISYCDKEKISNRRK